jgi:hypothetical protein
MANAGRLEPGAAYIYERANGTVYARKLGDSADQRFEVGHDYNHDTLYDDLIEAKLWGEILRAAEHNPALQDALDRVKVIYELSKQEDTIFHHSV